MATKSPFQTMLEHIDYGDFDELRDVLVMMGQDVEKQEKKLKLLEKKIKRINETHPSTAVKK